MGQPQDRASIRLDSDDFGAMHDMRLWREAVARSILGLDFFALDNKRFRTRISGTVLGGTTVSTSTTSPQLSRRDRELADHNGNAYVFAFAEQGPQEASQRGRSAGLQPGQATLLVSDEIGQIASPRGGVYTALIIPKTRLEGRVRGLDDKIARPIPEHAPRLRLVRQYTRLCARTAGEADEAMRAAMGAHLVDLVALALDAELPLVESPGQASVEASRLHLIRAAIEEQIDDAGLTLGRIAQACGLSPRSVQLALEKAGTSYSDTVLTLRLERAHAMLRGAPGARIIDVALAAGFADVSYFNRRFRARFGDTPSGIRAGRGGRALENGAD